MGIAAVLIVVGGATWYFAGGSKSAATVAQPSAASLPLAEPSKPLPHLSIVVLPFANLSGDATQDYFADGITESLTTDLSRISGSFVIARNTAFAFKGKNVDARTIGKELGVRYVLEGSVQRDQSQVRVNAQLIDAESGGHLWAERFDKPLSNLFSMQDEIVASLASRLGAELITNEARRAGRTPTPDSMDLYICSCTAVPQETAEPIVDLLNRGVSVVGIAAREDLTAKRSRPEMAAQRFEKIESAPGNGMVPEDSNPQYVVHGRAAGRARLRLTRRKNDKVRSSPPHACCERSPSSCARWGSLGVAGKLFLPANH